jgi:hypothetical protein
VFPFLSKLAKVEITNELAKPLTAIALRVWLLLRRSVFLSLFVTFFWLILCVFFFSLQVIFLVMGILALVVVPL